MEDRIENAKKMIALETNTPEEIAYILNLPLSDIQKLAREMKEKSGAE